MPKTPSDLFSDPPVSEDHTAEDAGGGATCSSLDSAHVGISFVPLSCQHVTKVALFPRTS